MVYLRDQRPVMDDTVSLQRGQLDCGSAQKGVRPDRRQYGQGGGAGQHLKKPPFIQTSSLTPPLLTTLEKAWW